MVAPKLNGATREGIEIQRAVSRQTAVREMRAAQHLALSRIEDPTTDHKSFVSLVSAYTQLREAIRIEKGWIKPGSRNVSVREVADGAPGRRLSAPRMRNADADFLRSAAEELARATAATGQ